MTPEGSADIYIYIYDPSAELGLARDSNDIQDVDVNVSPRSGVMPGICVAELGLGRDSNAGLELLLQEVDTPIYERRLNISDMQGLQITISEKQRPVKGLQASP